MRDLVVGHDETLRDAYERLERDPADRAALTIVIDTLELYRSAIGALSEAIVVQDAHGRVAAFNRSALRVLALGAEEMRGRTSADPEWRALRADGSPCPGEEHPASITLRTGEPQRGVVLGVQTGRGRRWLEVNTERIERGPGELAGGVVASFFDVTERREAEAQLRASLAEKELLLKEVHHRVKNNLQVIQSLLRMESRGARSTHERGLLLGAQARVRTIAAFHERSYRVGEVGRVDASEYLRDVTQGAHAAFGIGERVRLDFEATRVELDSDRAIPLGLFTNELVTNAFKHAFPFERPGTLSVRLRAADSGIVLVVADDGVGLDETRVSTDSLGLGIVRAMAQQLSGTLVREPGAGTTWRLELPP